MIPGLRGPLAALLGSLLAAGGALGLEGLLPKNVQERINKEPCKLSFEKAKAELLVKALNEKKILKIGMQAKLADKVIDKLDFTGSTLLQAIDLLAAKVGAKAFVLRDFVYITEVLPEGAKTANGEGEKADPGPRGILNQLDPSFLGIQVGQYRKLPWSGANPQACRDRARPILLFIHDRTAKDPSDALGFETLILEDPAAREAVKAFTCVLIDSANKDWPTTLTGQAKGGFAAFFCTADGKPHKSFSRKDRGNRATLDEFLAAAKQEEQSNIPVAKTLEAEKQKANAERAERARKAAGAGGGAGQPGGGAASRKGQGKGDPEKKKKEEEEEEEN